MESSHYTGTLRVKAEKQYYNFNTFARQTKPHKFSHTLLATATHI